MSNPSPKFPDLPRRLVVQSWLRSLSIFLFCFAAFGGSVVTALSIRATDHAQDTAAKAVAVTENFQLESECRSRLNNTVNGLEGEIMTTFVIALLNRVEGGTDEQAAAARKQLEGLVIEWETAEARRAKAAEICEEE